ncbi:MAG: hypothetical protein ACO3JG_13360 [Luteolibacter sp.]
MNGRPISSSVHNPVSYPCTMTPRLGASTLFIGRINGPTAG